ncbi:MAG: dTDP-4-dehydrorhamnose 3,5-epimerase [Rhabdochlamydiaceae bacterium]|nr:dTDP-4-dehydrorhamnose 3,5-epimerase [Rhabdochlamydiaceae bacterium]
MNAVSLTLEGVVLLQPKVFRDERGFFRETYRAALYQERGILDAFVQDNHSYSTQGTLRGMHFQRIPGQAKLITVVSGCIYDVVVDIRRESPTFGKWEGVYLNHETAEQLYIPVGFAHGFCVLSEEAHVMYKVSAYYDSEEERSFRFDDPTVGIVWPVQTPLLSVRDLKAPLFSEVV